MSDLFHERLRHIEAKFCELKTSAPCDITDTPKTAGVYVFYENGKPLYVGKSDNIAKRMGNHRRPSSRHNQATFAARIAEDELEKKGYKLKKYIPTKSLEHYTKHPQFDEVFNAAKERIKKMTICWVEEKESTNQTILEIYAAVTLGTIEKGYNNFENH